MNEQKLPVEQQSDIPEQQIIVETKQWIDKIIIGHNLCPFAKKPFKQDVIRYVVSTANSEKNLVDDLVAELAYLQDTATEKLETSILIMANCLADFDDYNQFLDVVDSTLEALDLVGIIQVASFHPDYCFADLSAQDVRNYTNRSIYPMFHFIREDSVEHARAAYPDVDLIPDKNMDLLLRIGLEAIQQQRNSCKSNQ